MHVLILLCLGGLLASAAADDISLVLDYDWEPALTDEAKWKPLFNCYMETEPCGKFQEVKDAVFRLYSTKCEKCTAEQKEKAEGMFKRALDKYANDIAEILTKKGLS